MNAARSKHETHDEWALWLKERHDLGMGWENRTTVFKGETGFDVPILPFSEMFVNRKETQAQGRWFVSTLRARGSEIGRGFYDMTDKLHKEIDHSCDLLYQFTPVYYYFKVVRQGESTHGDLVVFMQPNLIIGSRPVAVVREGGEG